MLKNALGLDGGGVDTLVALVEGGPLWDGDVPSKTSRDELIRQGLAMRVIVKCQDGFTAATYAGRDAYKGIFGGDTLAEARAGRKAKRAIQSARSKE